MAVQLFVCLWLCINIPSNKNRKMRPRPYVSEPLTILRHPIPPLFLEAVSLEDFLANFSRDTSRKLLELVPAHKTEFDFVTFLDMLFALEYDYCILPRSISHSKDHDYTIIEIYNKDQIRVDPASMFSFKIHIYDGFKKIQVFIKYHLYMLSRTYDGKIMLDFPGTYDTQLSLALSEYFIRNPELCPICILNHFKVVSESQRTGMCNIIFKILTIDEVLATCPGYISVVKSSDPDHPIHTLTIIFPWAIDNLKKSHYIELDASFDAAKPYSYCITQGIYFNESIPLAISIAPSECTALYQMFFDKINELTEGSVNWSEKAILSDMGTALKSIGQKYNINHFFCHRHILEHFGSLSPLGFFCRRLLKCYTMQKCKEVAAEISVQLNEYVKQKQNPSKDFNQKVEDLRTMLQLDSAQNTNSNYYYTKWALWIREKYHVATCSNHNEAFHGVLNKDLKPFRAWTTTLTHLIDNTIQHYKNLERRYGNSIRRKINTHIDKIRKKVEANSDIMQFCKDNCNCGESQFLFSLYGVQIPCIHQSLLPAKDTIKSMIDLLAQSKGDLTIYQLLASALTRPITRSSKQKIQSLQQEMSKEMPKGDDFKLDIPDENMHQFYQAIQACFPFPPRNPPKCIVDLGIHILTASTSEEKLVFPVKSLPPPQHQFIRCNFVSVDACLDLTENQKKLKNCAHQTMTEIYNAYFRKPNAKELAFGCCQDLYAKNFGPIQDANTQEKVLATLAEFKIACWKVADRVFQGTVFS